MTSLSRLVALPEELISNIAHRLGSDDIYSFRLTNKTIESKCFHEFATEYFTSKAVHFTSDSLRVIVGIANNKRLRDYLHELYIIPALFYEGAFQCPSGDKCGWRPTVRQSEAYRTYMLDQRQLKQSGTDREMLVEAFDKLPALQLVSLLDHTCGLKKTTDYRGFFSVSRKTNTHPIIGSSTNADGPEYKAWFSHVWRTLITALASSNSQSSITDFRTALSGQRQALSLQDIKFVKGTREGLRRTLGNVSRLRLSLKCQDASTGATRSEKTVSNFASIFKNTTDLMLHFDFDEMSGSLCSAFMSRMRLSTLTKLMLETLHISEGALTQMITSMPDLVDLQLEWINLQSGTWVPILKSLLKLEKLDHLHLMYLQEDRRKVFFLEQPTDEELEALDAQQDLLDDDWVDDDEDVEEDESDSEDDDDDEMPDLVTEDGTPVADTNTPDLVEYETPVTAGASEPSLSGNDDDEMPALEVEAVDPITKTTLTGAEVPSMLPSSSTVATGESEHRMPEHIPPGDEGCGERGFYVCVSGKEIARQLPIFIKEYNVGESTDAVHDIAMPPGMPANMPPAVFNNVMNNFAATFGAMAIPFPGAVPVAGGGGHGGHTGHGGHGGNGGHSH